MDLGIRGHVAIVQGASRGIGRGIAESLAAEGCHLLLTARGAAALEATAADLAARYGVRVLAHAGDSADLATNTALVDRARAEFGRLDIVVANSGGPTPGGIRDLTPEKIAAATNLVLVAPIHLLQTALPLLGASPAARLFVVTSSSTRQPVMGLTLSNMLRPAVVGLLKSLVEELGPTGLRCHSIAPGRIDTDRLGEVIRLQAGKLGKSPEQVREAMIQSIPGGRLGTPLDLGRLVAFLSSPLADYLNGGNWLVDGGLVRGI
jgi:3-oxoacyl-[acyl-carrier protein] reductase